ncbi:hypothetical protein [Archangium sp.]|uniref:hypothetical protein n=1 Tax=Archangium sp. TaxID=1872627 RepID=UPI002D24769C|nr:hypothetical protein [Archangium sp.]HYO60105.1 hypothetical protein [Archangium sp.]
MYASREATPVPVLEITHEGPALPTDDLPAPLRTVQVSTVTALRNAIAAAVAGDRIEVADGAYSLSDWVVVTRSGTAANPILR